MSPIIGGQTFLTAVTQSELIDSIVNILPESLQGEYTVPTVGLFIIFFVSALVHLVIRVWIIHLLHKLDEKTVSEWYAVILKHKLPQRALFIIPLLIIYNGLNLVPEIPEEVTDFIIRLTAATMVLVGARALDALLSSVHTLYLMNAGPDKAPIKSYIQLGKVIVYVFAGLFIVSSLADKSPWYFLTGIGAAMAIILLLFRDTLLSLVASVQLTNNDLIRVGDWIEMPQFGADGDVIDIALNTVLVQNFDKTISVIPTHKFLEHSFRNWRGMQETGGRRIMRSLNIDISSIRFLTYHEIERLRESILLKDYINEKMKDVHDYNSEYLKTSSSTLTNGRWLTNVGTFRAYIIEYLKKHPNAKKDLTMLVRQLEPTEKGLPLQVYVFVDTTVWAEYEGIQSDIFDHLLAIAPEFGLNIFQQPTGRDFRVLSSLN
ncbi:mechanosensitive ion channel family protein [Rhodohalobacter sp. 8-1]|uniref:mechanosensitive ion channel family protein n=1 Tax=Rhodohalobacter sp. 8-1 TaxID=3131972 RepID=UPI0030EB643D